jgi:Helix-turn-helix of DDE superfamily endonuclease
MVRYHDIKTKAYRILDLTSLTVDEFEQLVPAFEVAFVRHMREWTMEGKPRSGRRYSQYTNCPLPTPEDRLLFVLSYLKVAALQVAHGAMFEMSQSNANKWIHVLLVVLHQTLSDVGDLPGRHLQALRQRLAELASTAQQSGDTDSAASPFFTMAPNGRSVAPKTVLSKARVLAARKSAIR